MKLLWSRRTRPLPYRNNLISFVCQTRVATVRRMSMKPPLERKNPGALLTRASGDTIEKLSSGGK